MVHMHLLSLNDANTTVLSDLPVRVLSHLEKAIFFVRFQPVIGMQTFNLQI